MKKNIEDELIKIKETQEEIIENLIEMNKFLQYLNNYMNIRKDYLKKELNKKWWQL